MAGMAERAVGRAVDALVVGDVALAEDVIASDADIDEKYLLIHQKWLETMALQTPVAIDLRLMSSVLHLLVTLERMGDQATNIAKIVKSIEGHTHEPMILEIIREIGEVLVGPMVRTALEAFVQRTSISPCGSRKWMGRSTGSTAAWLMKLQTVRPTRTSWNGRCRC